MTAAQCTESSPRSTSSATELPQGTEHDANDETATMSRYGLREDTSVTLDAEGPFAEPGGKPPTTDTRDAQTQTIGLGSATQPMPVDTNPVRIKLPISKSEQHPHPRIRFREYAEQLRQQQYFEKKRRILQQRKRVLQKTITLSARLHRVSSWIGDGLVEISEQLDAAGFVRLHQHMQNLIDLSYSQWDRELHALDPLGNPNDRSTEAAGSSDVLSRLSSRAQADLFDFLTYLRSNPRFLVERFKVLTRSQIVSLWSAPRFHRQNPAESEYGSFSYGHGKILSQRSQSYSKNLEDYASSFERSNPLAFLLYNMFGTHQSSTDAENQLRLSTWSTVCAELMLTPGSAFQALVLNLLNCFASLYEWRARDSIELFLMDTLQKGSFLLDQFTETNTRAFVRKNQFKTPQAQEFFDTAVHDLFEILERCDGGFPTGALQFASAVLQKLPHLQHQSDFRGIFFSEWFLEHFLQFTINYPEHENMLLKFHVSNSARQKILRQLWLTVRDRVHDVYSANPIHPVDPTFQIRVQNIVGRVDALECKNPYATPDLRCSSNADETESSISISVSDVVHILEALSPQAIHGSRSDSHYFFERNSVYGQYLQASSRFDQLRGDLLLLLEPGSSIIDIHPCQERWLHLDIDQTGKPRLPQAQASQVTTTPAMDSEDLDSAQKGALRLFDSSSSDSSSALTDASYRSDLFESQALSQMFREMEISTTARLDPIGYTFWVKAVDTLHEKYPLSVLINDDTAVLTKIYQTSRTVQANCQVCCAKLEVQLSAMEGVLIQIRTAINKCVDRFESLRLKIWYSVDVVPSKQYDDAKNVSRALTNMAYSISRDSRPSSSMSYSGRTISATSSIFDQPYQETINMMKASTAYGGPKKLADQQIELTKSWLEQHEIENFCKGEERIHRFCMEISTAAKNLVGETLSESPVLWASELFARERSLYDVRTFGVTSAPASTRPASVISETMSTSYRSSRPALRSAESLRMALMDDRRPNGSNRFSKDSIPPKLASSIGSLSRAHSATTAESISDVFSPLPSNSRSVTSASIYSRAASIFNEPGLNRYTDTSKAKSKFIEKVRQVVVSLLLSDLGCQVWGLGSETDAMLEESRATELIDKRLRQRLVAETLADEPWNRSQGPKKMKGQRSQSVSGQPTRYPSLMGAEHTEQDTPVCLAEDSDEEHLFNLALLLDKLSQQIDPVEKLNIAEEFYELSLESLKSAKIQRDCDIPNRQQSSINPRRGSLDETWIQLQKQTFKDQMNSTHSRTTIAFSGQDIIKHLKSYLTRLRPKTLFRDLQYISAFAPIDRSNDTLRGKILLQLGLAALAYKEDVCRSMVDIADNMLSEQSTSPSAPQVMTKITGFWMFAAREGNPVAQRELALLYLSKPELLPVISLPFSLSSQVFQSNMLWHESDEHNTNTQALCLALHWMRHASVNGDKLAQRKLDERDGRISLH